MADCFNCSISGSGLCYVFQFIYCFSLKEPESESEPEKIRLSALFSPVHLVNSFRTVFKQRENRGRPILLLTLMSLFIVQITVCGEADILYIFMANIQTNDYFQYYFGFKNGIGALTLLLGLPVLKRSENVLDVYFILLIPLTTILFQIHTGSNDKAASLLQT